MTRREMAILRWFHDRLQEDGVAPTYRATAAHFGCSFKTIGVVMRALRQDGFVEREGPRTGRPKATTVRLPGKGLLSQEVAWCHANPERVRAMISVTGGCRMGDLH